MTFLKHLMEFVLGFAAILCVLFLVATTYGWDNIWQRTLGPVDPSPIQFEGLAKTSSPNQALICPNKLCVDQDRDLESPVYNLDAQALRNKLLASLDSEQNLERIDDDGDPLKLEFIQRSKIMKYPDIINVQLFDLEGGQSTLAFYSRSRVGQSDFGVNLKRVKRWLSYLSNAEAESLDQDDVIIPEE